MVAQEIKRLVDARGVSYTFIATKTGISVDALSKSFAGKRRMTADEMISICTAVGIDLVDLVASNKADKEKR